MGGLTASHLLRPSDIRLVVYDVDEALNVVDLGLPQGAGNKCLPLVSPGYPRRFLAGLFRSVGVGTVRAFQIIAATSALGAEATIVVEHALESAPDQVNDQVYLECTFEQARKVLPEATHIGVRVQLPIAGDECVVLFQARGFDYPSERPTADYIGESP